MEIIKVHINQKHNYTLKKMYFYTKQSIEDIISIEENQIYAYIDMQKPFEYLNMVNETYCGNQYELYITKSETCNVYNFALDSYLWHKKNKVHHNTDFYSLRQTLNMMLKYTLAE